MENEHDPTLIRICWRCENKFRVILESTWSPGDSQGRYPATSHGSLVHFLFVNRWESFTILGLGLFAGLTVFATRKPMCRDVCAGACTPVYKEEKRLRCRSDTGLINRAIQGAGAESQCGPRAVRFFRRGLWLLQSLNSEYCTF